MLYSSVNNEKIKNIKKLNTKKYRDETNLYLVEGEHLVKEAYENNVLEELILLENTNINIDVKTSYVTKNVLKFISNLETPNGIIGICKKKGNKLQGNKIVILEDIQDPGNLGTIIRSSVAFNVDTLVLSSNTVDLYNPKVIRATQGMLFKLNIIIENNLEKLIKNLKQNNYTIYTTNVKNGNSLKTIEKKDRIAIIMGNEGSGVSDKLNSLADEYLYIDMNKNCESLNVAVATSIILYELDK
jgi:TrmH family RNA methyltransferase